MYVSRNARSHHLWALEHEDPFQGVKDSNTSPKWCMMPPCYDYVRYEPVKGK